MILFPIVIAGALALQDHQDHSAHAGHSPAAEQPTPPASQDHRLGMQMPVEDPPTSNAMNHNDMSHDAMDHAAMGHEMSAEPPTEKPEKDHGDHQQMAHDMHAAPKGDAQEVDHAAMGHAMPGDDDIPLAGPPAAAGSGPARAAIEIWGEEAMRQAREELIEDTDGGTHLLVMADRAELRTDGRHGSYLWDVQGWYGGDIDKLWIKSEGEGEFGGSLESADVEALWSRAIAPFFDAQVGVRQDLTGPERTYLAVGILGLAPYEFEVDATAYLSTKGDLTAKLEAEVDQRVTQRLILQPRTEVRLSAQDVPELGIGSGLSVIEAGLRLRYELSREFAPYIGVAHEWRVGRTGDFARAEGEDSSVTRLVAGVRAWF